MDDENTTPTRRAKVYAPVIIPCEVCYRPLSHEELLVSKTRCARDLDWRPSGR